MMGTITDDSYPNPCRFTLRKDSNGDVPQLATFLRVADPSFQVMTGTFGAWYPALALGITAIVSAMANCCPDEITEVQEQVLCM